MKKLIKCSISVGFIIFSLGGCVVNSSSIVTKDQLLDSPYHKIQAVYTEKNTSIVFDQNGAKLNTYNDLISGQLINGSKVIIPFEQIRSFRTKLPKASEMITKAEKRIKAVLLITDSYIEFADSGAVYSPLEERIRGINTEGQNSSFSVIGIKEFYDKYPDTVSSEDIRTLKVSRIKQVCLIENNEVLTFNDEGGKYRSEAILISGINKRGEKLWLNSDDISRYMVGGVNTTLTILANAGIGIVAVGLIVAVLMGGSQFSFDLGDSFHF